ncbi:TetR/AcrR family transcriptional regulator [Novosphingobium sp. G106]|uniref:TetR/AcrR family transcriptional regulator n=1 Tax=Novosphingobium sp. G106 TaxID=2849500 RepID=UPI001C2DB1D3|nr:TetR/AcrR family transcriptional regulator [Novosphingobium sp. G106]MBV1690395.1 TetR/AcrR family transcriptional regulator [Novosphingobium sp. G106]
MASSTRNRWSRKNKPPRAARIPCGRVTSAEHERRNARILDAARDVFLLRGYADATIGEIAFRAGTSPKTLTRHFCGKHTLLREVILTICGAGQDVVLAVNAGEPLRVALLRAAQYVNSSILCVRDAALLSLVVAAQKLFPELLAVTGNSVQERIKGAVATMLAELGKQGLNFEEDYATAASVFVNLVVGFPTTRFAQMAALAEADDLLQAKVDLFMNGVLSPAGLDGGPPSKSGVKYE